MTPTGVAPPDPETHGTVPSFESIDLDDPGPLLAAGVCADVFALSDEYVLRRYRSGRDAGAEVAVLEHVVGLGFPAPRVYASQGPLLLMERLHGPTLLQALAAGEVSLTDGAAVLADLHARLHALPVPAAWDGGDESWPHATGGPAIVHLDLHPGNVILTSTGPAVVDWANARTGTPALDVVVTALVLAEVAVDAGGDYSHAARALLVAYLAHTDLAHADTDVLAVLDDAAALRHQDPALVSGEYELVAPAVALVRTLVELAR
ncbi:phosphotransferase family protein [Cellulomonas composti]|uniref:Aminoglycoside phosphotransferase domain-containing protein n=1 Tax=Cellulomonas composti TaxID=266130 RepID=A0A511J8F1_9CELL|nr:phosphotransferase [Cellulomonas composti]GEL93993.1 hypothetical protein CCO02nite_06510 [Cellulomonas composti]